MCARRGKLYIIIREKLFRKSSKSLFSWITHRSALRPWRQKPGRAAEQLPLSPTFWCSCSRWSLRPFYCALSASRGEIKRKNIMGKLKQRTEKCPHPGGLRSGLRLRAAPAEPAWVARSNCDPCFQVFSFFLSPKKESSPRMRRDVARIIRMTSCTSRACLHIIGKNDEHIFKNKPKHT